MLALQLDNLQRFNGQFGPARRHRYVVRQAWVDLPWALAAAEPGEGYRPCARLIRGRNWSPAPGPAPPGPADTSYPPTVAAGTGRAPVPAYPQRP
jgi:hypothetical protein